MPLQTFPPGNLALTGTAVVTDFGADPTATHDSTAAFTRAFAASASVFVPPGIYLVGPLAPTTTIRLSGAGRTLSILKLAPNANAGLLTLTGLVGCEIADLGFNGNNTNQSVFTTDPYAADGVQSAAVKQGANIITVVGGSDHRISRCRLTNAIRAGVGIFGASRVAVVECSGSNNGYGSYLVGTSTFGVTTEAGISSEFIRFLQCVAEGDYCDGFRTIGDNAVRFDTCESRYARFPQPGDLSYPGDQYGPAGYGGFYCEGGARLTLTGCHAIGNSGFGFDLNSPGADTTHGSIQVTGGSSCDNAQGGTHSVTAGTVFTGVVFRNNGNRTFTGRPNATGSSVASQLPYAFGALIDAPSTFNGCQVSGNSYGLVRGGTAITGSLIANNTFSGNGTNLSLGSDTITLVNNATN